MCNSATENRQVVSAVTRDEKQVELEEKTRFALTFKATCVKSTDGSFEKGRPTKEEIHRKRQ